MQARIKKLLPSATIPEYHTKESAGFDLAAGEDMVIKPYQLGKIRTGLVIEAPRDHFLMISARSSLPLKKGLMLSNGIGVVDRDYSGENDEISIIVYNFTDQPVQVKAGERLAQGIFLPIEQAEWEEVEIMGKNDRGGYGTTGGYKQ